MHETTFSPQGGHTSVAAFLRQPAEWKNSVLGTLCFSADIFEQWTQAEMATPVLRVAMPRLDAGDSVCEVWRGSEPLTHGQRGAIRYRHDESVLFGVLELSETPFAASADKTPLQQATASAYGEIFSLLDTLNFPHLFRCWNYISDINAYSFGKERYQQFNQGRHDAFLTYGRNVMGNAPAACALGKKQGPLSIAFLAGRAAPQCIENPRQISAYEYPPQYGQRSPTFSRASLAQLGQDEVLFISGTASIVGHATLHPADIVAQTRETMANIGAVLAEANRLASRPFSLSDLYFRTYVRHPADLAPIRQELGRCVGDAIKVGYLQADVCRHDLLLEIEATAAHPSARTPGKRD